MRLQYKYILVQNFFKEKSPVVVQGRTVYGAKDVKELSPDALACGYP
jgi:hypothetical protein